MQINLNNACRIFAILCALTACLIALAVIALWHYAPADLLGFDPGRPAMGPRAAGAIGIAGITLLFLSFPARLLIQRSITVATGGFLFIIGIFAIAEAELGKHLELNTHDLEIIANAGYHQAYAHLPHPVSGALFALLGMSFILWTFRIFQAQLVLFFCVGLASAVLLGHVYDIPFFFRLTSQHPLAGTSALTASSIALLCIGMLFSRSNESVVRIALAGGPAGAVLARFGLAAIGVLAILGPLTALRAPLSAIHILELKESLTAAIFAGVAALVWSSVRVLERLEQERLEALQSLEESRERLLYAQRMARLGYWHWNLVDDRVHASENLLRLLGLPGDEGIAFSYEDFTRNVHPEDRRQLKEALYRCLAGHSFFKVDFRVVHPGGEIFHLHSQAHIELDGNGLPWQMRGTCHDVTDVKLTEARAERLLKQANEAVRVREDVLSIVSHDLKNPLASANLGIQVLIRQLKIRPEDAGIYRTALTVQRSIDNMKMLIQSILDIGKLESGTFAVDLRPVDTRELLSSLDAVMQPIARDRGVELSVDLNTPSGKILGDQSRLLQVLFNLVGNALKFTPRGRNVYVRCDHEGASQIFLVEDNGPGIPAAQLANVFRRNWQARATAGDGNGLGLYIAKGIVDSHGGRIWLESEEGRGCRFRFSIPEAEQAVTTLNQSPPWNDRPAIV